MVDETGRSALRGGSALLAVQAARATHTYESVLSGCRIGRGAQAAMLNRSLFEDALDVAWVAENQGLAPTQADEHERLLELAERSRLAHYGREVAALDPEEHEELKRLLKRYDNSASPGRWQATLSVCWRSSGVGQARPRTTST
jgi:hypothetical protein